VSDTGSLTIAMVHRLFPGEDAAGLDAALVEAANAGAQLAVLPELPLDSWAPAAKTPRDEDTEELGGRRQRALAAAAREARIAVLGGAIVRDENGRRRNRALLLDASGTPIGHYDKLHLPSEEGFWESDHYEAGDALPERIDLLGFGLGVQICSDLNRPQGSQLLAAQGAAAILGPRATPESGYERWRTVIRANALTCSTWVVSVNRPAEPELALSPGGPSLCVDPEGRVVAESTEPLTLVTLEQDAVARARREYPGYLDVRSSLYARGWAELGE
jgi:predicted amidohydrolase